MGEVRIHMHSLLGEPDTLPLDYIDTARNTIA